MDFLIVSPEFILSLLCTQQWSKNSFLMCFCFISLQASLKSECRTKRSVKINTFSRRQAFYYEQRVTLKNIFARVLTDERKNVQISLGFMEKRDPLLCWFTLPNVSCSYQIQSIYWIFQSCAQLRLFCKKKGFCANPLHDFLV